MSYKPWQAGDAAWFKANPTRSHLVREAFPNEWLPAGKPPPGHRYVSVLRQLEPGIRLRTSFALAEDAPEPEQFYEDYAAALFDILDEPISSDRVITTDRIKRKAECWQEVSNHAH